ncbi:electron transfer flavoprotein subunit alpha [Marinifilum sp. N1E240]|uniref:electron transfer flavoprotein subunit alpha/FixB family protein n=1 Tax=Marinifilum sp. N1E240 TaxID=2608082 RepID=UPI001417BE52|nr:electron transfer flavoprotein subunit alpha/FixB family protein [uncultured Marinifilum sp.]MPQ47373.1 electron transfer flavoprotein subunit alpha [Marinifilum sp. N1E240]
MNNVFVYCEIEEGQVADVSLELLTKGRKLADDLKCELEAIVIGENLKGVEKQIMPYGVDKVWIADDKRLYPYTTLPHTSIIVKLFEEVKPQIALMGATSIGRDLGPRVSSALHSGLTADCTSLVIGDHTDKKNKKDYKDLLYQIRPAFGGNIVATIINPDCRPQMATVREGVMKKEVRSDAYKGKVNKLDVEKYVNAEDFVVKVIERHMEKSKVNIKNAGIIVAGGYGVGSKANFDLLTELAEVIGGEVGASRAAVDAGFASHERQIGQTGVTVRPKLYIACGISGQIQHTAGMEESAMVIAINTDKNAPINNFADYVITGDIATVLPKMIKQYKENTK